MKHNERSVKSGVVCKQVLAYQAFYKYKKESSPAIRQGGRKEMKLI